MKNSGHFVLLSVLLSAPLLPTTALAAAKTGDCPAVKVAFTASDLLGSTTNSMALVNLPEASVAFSQKGNKAACVVVEFFANSIEAPGELLGVQALLDGAPMFPNVVVFSSDSDENANGNGSAARAFSWVSSAAPGAHVVQIVYASQNGTPVTINKHTTLVLHR
ncbi:MAG: hypothetical protein JO056_08365 [Alphaproteobacteria bacterium]|nr:hypothetical protein [Alphaproteobacteria bacterium]